jgi:hypothetical protein
LERHGRSFRHISPWLTVEEFTREGARLFRRRVTGQASRQPSRQESIRVDTCARHRGDGLLDQSRIVCFQPFLRSAAAKDSREVVWLEGSTFPDVVLGAFCDFLFRIFSLAWLYALGTDRIENTVSNNSSVVASLPACPFHSDCSGIVVAYGPLPSDGWCILLGVSVFIKPLHSKGYFF